MALTNGMHDQILRTDSDVSFNSINLGSLPKRDQAILDAYGIINKGFGFPVVNSAQMSEIANAEGMVIYNTQFKCLCVNDGNGWLKIPTARL
jgi:hypothetical protein